MEGGIRGVIVVISAFMIQFLALGSSQCIGIYTVHFLQAFDNDIVGVSFISSIHIGFLYGLGPVTSFLLSRFSYRAVCVTGATLVSVGLLGVYLFPYLTAIYLFLGLFCGIGGLFIYLPSHVLTGLYYDKHRTLSTGIATAGTSMAAFLMPIIVGLLIDQYTWRGSFLIFAGLQLHLFIFAIFMNPPDNNILKIRTNSRVSLLVDENRAGWNNSDRNDGPMEGKRAPDEEASDDVMADDKTVFSKAHPCNGNGDWDAETTKAREETHLFDSKDGVNSVKEFQDPESMPRLARTPIMDQDEYEVEIGPSAFGGDSVTVRSQILSHIAVLTDFKCVLYLTSTFIWCLTLMLFCTFAPDHIHRHGHSAQTSAFLYSFYGLGQFVGCILVSFLGNFIGYRVVLYCIMCALTGVFIALLPLAHTLSEFAMVLTSIGLPYGGVLALSFIVVVDFVGSDVMDVGLAYVLLATGIGSFVGPPIGAVLEKMSGSHDVAMHLAGLLTACSGFIVLPALHPRYRLPLHTKVPEQTSPAQVDASPSTTTTEQTSPANIPSTTTTEHASPANIPSTTTTEHASPANIPSTTTTEHASPANIPSTTTTEQASPANIPSTTTTEQASPANIPSTTTTEHASPANIASTTTTEQTSPANFH